MLTPTKTGLSTLALAASCGVRCLEVEGVTVHVERDKNRGLNLWGCLGFDEAEAAQVDAAGLHGCAGSAIYGVGATRTASPRAAGRCTMPLITESAATKLSRIAPRA